MTRKKDIGILTYHRALNYGAVLQAYGLWAALDARGASAQIIDYRNELIEATYRPDTDMDVRIGSLREQAPLMRVRFRKARRFRDFLESEARLSQPCQRDTIARIASRYAAVIVGSDQVFNPRSNGQDAAYFLDFATEKTKRYSYAASMGKFQDQTVRDKRTIEALDRFECVSVREDTAFSALSGQISPPLRLDVDPAFLLDREAWNRIIPTDRIRKEPFVFCYSVNPFKSGLDRGRELAHARGCELVYIDNRVNTAHPTNRFGDPVVRDASPYDWLRYIRDAEFVITNSFHGTAFSLIFQIPFLSEVDTWAGFNNRIWHLLGEVGLHGRILDAANLKRVSFDGLVGNPISWDSVNALMAQRRDESLSYLRSII